jgi:hypothetical protein
MSHRIYRGTKVYLIKSPHSCLHRGPPLAMQALLVALESLTDRVVFKSQAFSW